jgi:prevent-host-death family protein
VYTCDMTVTEISTRQARDRLADVVEDARRGEPTVITNRGRRVAAVVPVEMLEEYERLADQADAAIIRERLARVDAGEGTVSIEEVIAETLGRDE